MLSHTWPAQRPFSMKSVEAFSSATGRKRRCSRVAASIFISLSTKLPLLARPGPDCGRAGSAGRT